MKRIIILICYLAYYLTFQSIVAQKKEIELIILVHGTVNPKPILCLGTAFKIMQDNIDDSRYKKVIDIVRDDPFFHTCQPMEIRGLQKINLKNKQKFSASRLFAEIYDQIYSETCRTKNQKRCYYTFGWSGLLSAKTRYNEAVNFYTQLKKETERLESKNYKITITIIGYSHGGNVVLNIAAVRDKIFINDKFIIDNIILLGTPIQENTHDYAYSPIFNKIYNFYSRSDIVQKIDCFSSKNFFSRRMFSCKERHLPKNLRQVEIKTCSVKKTYKCGCPKQVFRISPHHAELWCFGWNNSGYREKFPLYPLPIAVFISKLINIVDQQKHLDVTVTILPELGSLYLQNYHKLYSCKKEYNFITLENLNKYKDLALSNKPHEQKPYRRKKRVLSAKLLARNA